MTTPLRNPDKFDLQGHTILIIDDEPANLGMMSAYLESFNLEVLIARDGKSGLEKARYARPDLILLDVRMPGIDGFETCRRLKADEIARDIPVFFMTALTGTEDKVKGFQLGAVDYVTKPFQHEELLARVTTHLRLRDLTERLEHKVRQRTEELIQANQWLLQEISERKQAEKELQYRNRELTLLNQVIAASVTETNQEAILEITCRELAVAFGVPQAAAALLNEQKTEAVVVAEYLAPGRPSGLEKVIPVEGNPSFEYLLSHRRPLSVDDAQNDPRLATVHDLLRQRGTMSLLIIPLIIDGEVVGSLALDAIETRHFTTEEISLAQRVADQVAGVMARIRLDEERQQLEAQYYQAQKMEAIGRLTGGVAHDFNNLLTVINGYSELLLFRYLDDDDPACKDIEQIRLAGERAAALTRQLLAFSRQQILQPQVLDLNEIVTNFEKMLRRLIGEDIELRTVLKPQLGKVVADAGQIEQVIMNLAVNARDAMPQGGKLTIETTNVYLDETYARQHVDVVAGSYVMLAVSDTGVGMDAETQAHIFEPFFTSKEQDKGTGLGLATVHGIVKQSGGHIYVYSELGYGTTFKIYLPPIEADAELVEQTQVSIEVGQGTETVLLVEDDDLVRLVTHQILLSGGYTVLEANTSEQARQIHTEYKEPIHLLLTDVVMPGGMSGPELAKELVSLRPEMKVLYMSGYTDNAIVHHGVLDPAIAFLPKPFAPGDLLRQVRHVLDEKEGGRVVQREG